MKIEVLAYESEWAAQYESLRKNIWPVVQDVALGIEHVGSTSVPGMAAKPIIDIDIIAKSPDDIRTIIVQLQTLGYVHRGQLGIADREAFQAGDAVVKHNLYACLDGCLALRNHLWVRNYLRANPEACREYSDLKIRLARQFPEDIDSYVAGKTEFILSILRQYGLTEKELESIRAANAT